MKKVIGYFIISVLGIALIFYLKWIVGNAIDLYKLSPIVFWLCSGIIIIPVLFLFLVWITEKAISWIKS